MSGTTAHLRRLVGLCLLAAAFALTEAIAIPAASAGQGKKLDPPTLLWKSYPLERRPNTTEQKPAQIRGRQTSRQTSAHKDGFLTPALVGAFLLLLASTAIVLMRRSRPVRVGKARRTPDRAPVRRSAQPASVNRPHWRPRRPHQLREVIPEVVAVVDPEEARPGPTPEPVKQRPATQPKLWETCDLLVEEREAEPGPSRESQLGLELLTRIVDVHLVPVPEPRPHTAEDPYEDGTA
jgi:hypothetical protein